MPRDLVCLMSALRAGEEPGKDGAEGEGADGGDQGAKHLPSLPCLTPCLHFASELLDF